MRNQKYFTATAKRFNRAIHMEPQDSHAVAWLLDRIEGGDIKAIIAAIQVEIANTADEIGISKHAMVCKLNKVGFRLMKPNVMAMHLGESQRVTAEGKAFIEQHANDPHSIISAPAIDVKEIVPEDLETDEQRLDFYRKKLADASNIGDARNIKLYGELHLKTSDSLRRNEIHATKVGLKSGDVMTRAEIERIMKSALYAGNACVHLQLSAICERLAGISDPAELYHVLKPLLVGGLIFSGFSKATSIGVPDWFIELVRQEAQNYVGNSECLD
jgi:hypothetical protein